MEGLLSTGPTLSSYNRWSLSRATQLFCLVENRCVAWLDQGSSDSNQQSLKGG